MSGRFRLHSVSKRKRFLAAVTAAGCLIATQSSAEVKSVQNDPARLRSGAPSISVKADLTIGVEDGDEELMFGRIFDIAVDTQGNILVADAGYRLVRAFDAKGGFLHVLGREGEGPGEYFEPSAVATDIRDHVYIGSRGKVSEFDNRGSYVREFRHGLSSPVRKIRVDVDSGLFLSCFEAFEQKILHKYRLTDGAHVLSFCDSYALGKSVDTRIEQVTAGGAIDISEEGLVYFTQMTPYEVRVFSPDGDLLTTINRKNDFMNPMKVEKDEFGVTTYRPFTNSSAIVMISNGRFINVVTVVVDTTGRETVLDVFDRSGRLIATRRFESLLFIKCSDGEDKLYAIDLDGYPKVKRYVVSVE